MNGFLQDLRYAIRQLLSKPGFTAIVVLTLVLGIGTNTAIFSVVYGIVFRPLPYPEAHQIMQLAESANGDTEEMDVTYSEFHFLKDRSGSAFASFAAFTAGGLNTATSRGLERINGLQVSADFFGVFGVRPILGREILPDEDQGNGARVAVLSYQFWRNRIAGNPSVLGSTITLDGEPYTVVGVMPPDFERLEITPVSRGATDVWTPLSLVAGTAGIDQNLAVIGRLKSDVSVERARAEISSLTKEFLKAFPGEIAPSSQLYLEPYQSILSGDLSIILFMLFGAVAFVLLIACTNIANLLLARGAARAKEMAVRVALGASRARLFRQLLTEGLLLSLSGALLSLLIVGPEVRGLLALSPVDLPRVVDIRIDTATLLFALVVAMLTGVIFGFAPALTIRNDGLNQALGDAGGHTTSGRTQARLRRVLVVTEIAFSFVLLVGAGLLIQTFRHVLSTDPGFDLAHLLSMQIWLGGSTYHSDPGAAYDEVVKQVNTMPGVRSAAVVAAGLPLERGANIGVKIFGREFPGSVEYRIVTPDYFAVLDVPLKLGRLFTSVDNHGSAKVAIVSAAFVRQGLTDQNPIGQHVALGNLDQAEIVGVVGDVRSYLDRPPQPVVFIPAAQVSYTELAIWERWFPTNLLLLTSSSPSALSHSIEAALQRLNASIVTGNVRTMNEVRSSAVSLRRLETALLSIFAALAVFLAAIGVYAVIAHATTQRTSEIGVRMALGAKPFDIANLVLREALLLVGVGVGVGLAAALAITRVLSGLLYGVKPIDPFTLTATSVVLILVILISCCVPAIRAARVHPVAALRYQ